MSETFILKSVFCSFSNQSTKSAATATQPQTSGRIDG